jgi:predicted DNA-binding protein (MmcQ/YjbR family)
VKATRFDAELTQGHKGVVVAIVPFDPQQRWRCEPVRLAGRRHGWPVTGKMNGAKLEGYIGERWGRFFVIIDRELRAAARVAVGDRVSLDITPTAAPHVLEKAVAQSRVTTQPSTARVEKAARAAPSEKRALEEMRAICLAFPNAKESRHFGSPSFKVGSNMFATFNTKDPTSIVFAPQPERAARLLATDRRFRQYPRAKQGIMIDAAAVTDWNELRDLLRESYEIHGLKRRAKKDRSLGPPGAPRRARP